MDAKSIQVNELTISYYEKRGSGQPILFVHGNSSNAHAFETIWNSSELKGFHLLAIDLPGHGNSPKADDPESYRILNLSKLIAQFIHQMKLENVLLVGHSLGGHFCIHALEFADKIAGLMLISAPPLASGEDLPKGYVIVPGIMPMFQNTISEEELENIIPLEVHDMKFGKIVSDAIRMADGRCRETMGKELGTYFTSPSFVSEVDLLKKPGLRVAFALGQQEKLINREYLQNLNGLKFWRNKLQLIPDAGHCAVFEQPQATAKLISDWVQNV